MGLGGATADDTEAELIRGICELELLEGEKGCWVSLPQPGSPSHTLTCSLNQANRHWLPLFHFCLKSATTLVSIATQSSPQLLHSPRASSA